MSQKNRADLTSDVASEFPDNTSGLITPAKLRTFLVNIVDSFHNILTDGVAALSSALSAHTGNTSNPHSVTKAQVGLGSVDNTSDLDKPISTATQTALNGKENTGHTHAYSSLTGIPSTFTPANHDHSGNKLAQANTHESVDTDSAPTSLHHTLGTGANQACAGNDSRLSDSRAPTAHASTHTIGQSDAIKLDDLAAPDDNTDLDASTSKHGLMPKADKVKMEALSARKETIWVPAAAMTPSTTNGAASASAEQSTNKQMLVTLDFDSGADEYAQFVVAMPKSWDEGTVTAQFVWTHGSTTTNFGVAFGLQGVAISNDDPIDASWGTEQLAVDTGGTAGDLYTTPETSAITIGGSPAEGDVVWFRVLRDVSDAGDTLAVDAKLVGVKLFLTLNAVTDA